MENVVAFNSELSSLYESKPPISKAKMASITRAAMKAIKFYKHVVQSVEKFILKCKPEYKVPGLYVIDSIVRQSRHQFGAEKDVFAPRFARNMKQTFANLFRCASDDKSRIIRVLNLWQKNNVFAPEVIQPLFDLADPNHPIYQQQNDISSQDLSSLSNGLNTSGIGGIIQDNINTSDDNHLQSSDIISHQSANALDQNTIRQLQQLQQILIRQTTNDGPSTTSSGGTGGGIGNSSQSDSIKFNKKVLDYDYGEDEEEEKSDSPHITNILDSKNLTQLLKDPNVLRQLQTIQKFKEQEEKQSKLKEMRIQEEAFEKHVQNVLKGSSGSSMGNTVINESHIGHTDKNLQNLVDDAPVIEVINLEDGNDSRSSSPDRDRSYKRRRSSRSRSRDRGGGGGGVGSSRSGGGNDRDRDGRSDRRRRSTKSRSRSRSPRSNRRRSSRERDRERDRDRDRSNTTRDKDKEREKEREYERERRRKGLPDIKKEHLTVCSNTLWVGHLSKLVHQEELSDTFGKYGDIISIDMIYPRGCAFIVMNRRQDAFKAMQNLKNHKLQGRAITISWAAGKGVKSKEWKDYWDLDLGVSYIPWSKLDDNTDLDDLEEGGMFDEDSMPIWMKQKINQKKEIQEKKPQQIYNVEGGVPPLDTSQPPPGAPGPPGPMMSSVSLIPQFSPMGAVSRMMPPPLGVPIPGNMVPGLPMAPNMVPGIPPPHIMMPPPGGMVPGFTGMGGPIDKSMPSQAGVPPQDGPPASLPPPFMTANIGNIHIPPNMAPQQSPFGAMGLPPQFQHALSNQSVSPAGIGNINQGDDHMDIEMEDENPPVMNKLGGPSGPQPLFNQPPPLFSSLPNEMPLAQLGNENQRNEQESRGNNEDRRDIDFGRASRSRDNRNSDFNNKRDKEQNRWGPPNPLIGDNESDRSSDRDKMINIRDFNGSSQQESGRPIPSIWQDNGPVPGPNFQPPPLFGDNQRRVPMDIPSLDAQQHLQRLHFEMRRNNDFPLDDRRVGFQQQQQQQRDFFQNLNNLNIPNMGNMGRPPPPNLNRNAPMPMRSPFGPRLGPMFARGPPGRQGPPGFNFNDRPIFDREDGRGAGGGGVGGGGGGERGGAARGRNNDMQNRRGGRNNDENRRGNSGNRFQNRDRDGPNDRRGGDKNDRERDRGRDRSRGARDRNNDRDGQRDRNSRNGSSEPRSQNDTSQSTMVQSTTPHDTEEDWDNELSEHNVEQNSNNNQDREREQQEQQFEQQQEQQFHQQEHQQQQQQQQSENLESWDSADENAFDNSFDEQNSSGGGGSGRNNEIEKDTNTENVMQCSDSTNLTTNNDNQDFMSIDSSQGENNEIVD